MPVVCFLKWVYNYFLLFHLFTWPKRKIVTFYQINLSWENFICLRTVSYLQHLLYRTNHVKRLASLCISICNKTKTTQYIDFVFLLIFLAQIMVNKQDDTARYWPTHSQKFSGFSRPKFSRQNLAQNIRRHFWFVNIQKSKLRGVCISFRGAGQAISSFSIPARTCLGSRYLFVLQHIVYKWKSSSKYQKAE